MTERTADTARSRLLLDTRREALMRAIWQETAHLTDYDAVPFEEAITRPRYQFLRETLWHAADRVMSVVAGESRGDGENAGSQPKVE